ncbi:MAG: SulP family inorganic anion transporter, partial [Actinomycetota bacterium]
MLTRHAPGVRMAQTYERRWLRDDLGAGLSLTALLVPQGMAYAELAGLPAVTGLYTTVAALAAYALLGPSRILVLGPDSALGPLIFAALVPVAAVGAGGEADLVAAAGVLALMMGVVSLTAGLTGLGRLAELLSKPARIGYLNGLAVTIFVSQLPKLLGFTIDAEGLIGETGAVVEAILDGKVDGPSAAIGIGVVAVILLVRWRFPQAPAVLVGTVGSILAVIAFDLGSRVATVGTLPSGIPAPSL